MRVIFKTKEVEFEWSQNMSDTNHSELTNSENALDRQLKAIAAIISNCLNAHKEITECNKQKGGKE